MSIGAGAFAESAVAHLPFVHLHSPLTRQEGGVVWQLRAPRAVLAALVGGMLAIAGASYQGVFRNPLCDPYLLGVAGGAGLRHARDDLRLGGRGRELARPARRVHGSYRCGRRHLRARPLSGRREHNGRAHSRGCDYGDLHGRGADVRPTTAHSTATERLLAARRLLDFNLDHVAICAPYIAASSLVLILHRRNLTCLASATTRR